jgi:drug/metabolite transporter (DMT)-like permease
VAVRVACGNTPLGWRPLGGILCVWAGIVLLNLTTAVSFHNWLRALDPRTLLREPGAWGMLVYAFGLATARLIDKSVAGVAPPLLYAFVNNAPCVLAGIAILAWRKQAALPWALLRERPAVAWVGSAAGMGAYIALLFALRRFPPSTVEPVTQLSVFIAVALGGLWFKEPARARWLPSALVVAGAALLLWRG